jgi:hypothetical protein
LSLLGTNSNELWKIISKLTILDAKKMMRYEFHSLDKMDEYKKWLMKLTHVDESKNDRWFSSIMYVK